MFSQDPHILVLSMNSTPNWYPAYESVALFGRDSVRACPEQKPGRSSARESLSTGAVFWLITLVTSWS